MKQYLLFAYAGYYPAGGWHDLCGDFDTIEDALICLVDMDRYNSEFWHIIDSTTMKCVKSKGYAEKG